MIDKYTAIMKAADHIEQHPESFKFINTLIPNGPESIYPSCALAWIGTFSDLEFDSWDKDTSFGMHYVTRWLEVSDREFFKRMDSLQSWWVRSVFAPYEGTWRRNAKQCAKCLRRYAAKYHTPVKPVQSVPDWNAMAASQTVSIHARSEELM